MSGCVTNIPGNIYQVKLPNLFSAGNQKQKQILAGPNLLKKVKKIYSSLHERGLDIYLLIQLVALCLIVFI